MGKQPIEPPPRGKDWTHAQITEYAAACVRDGLVDGAIVVRRGELHHDKKLRRNWGVVTDLERWLRGTAPYVPLTITWFKDNQSSRMWAEDLMIIFPMWTYSDLEEVLKQPVFSIQKPMPMDPSVPDPDDDIPC